MSTYGRYDSGVDASNIGSLTITSIAPGDFSAYQIVFHDGLVMEGNETITWTPGEVVFGIDSGVSTINDVLDAAVTGPPWATLGVYTDQTGPLHADDSTRLFSGMSHFYVGPYIATQPVSLTKIAGQDATFSAVVAGDPPLAYKWFKGVSVIPGANSSSYVISSVGVSDATSYYLDASNSTHPEYGSADSSTVTLTVLVPASISVQPTSRAQVLGNPTTFSVTAAGTSPFTYQWKKDGTSVGTNASTYTIASVVAASAGSYTVTVDNTCASPVVSNPAVLTVLTPASITTQPVSLVKITGQSATFSVVAAGTTPFTYQWIKGAAPITDATFASYTIASVSTANSGSYKVTVDNTCVTPLDSSVVTLHIAPTITVHPSPQSVTEEDPASFSVTAVGDAVLTYQWKKDGSNIPGATSSTYSIAHTIPSDVGSYATRVINAYGYADSNSAPLTLTIDSPVIINQPYDTSAFTGGTALLGVDASSVVGAMTYQWFKNNVGIVGATDATYTITNVVESNAGSYFVKVSDAFNTITSGSAQLTVPDNYPKTWVIPNGGIYAIGSTGRQYRIRNAWITDGTSSVPLGVQQIIDI